MKNRIFLFILVLSFFGVKSNAQLMEHGDDELNQLNLYVKYINESRNVLNLLYAEVANGSKELSENFESSIYHVPSQTLLERETCLFMAVVIKSNSKRHKTEIFNGLNDQLSTLKKLEKELDVFVIEKTKKLKNMEQLSLEALKPHFKGIQDAQSEILKTLHQIEFKDKLCKPCQSSINLYQEVTSLFDINNLEASKLTASKINNEIEQLDFSSWEEFTYPKELIEKAIAKTKELTTEISANGLTKATRNSLLAEFYYHTEGLPILYNNAFVKFKNQNKETKYIDLDIVPIEIF